MTRPPRRIGEPLFRRRDLLLAALQGACLLGVVFAVYAISLARAPESEARAAAFMTLTASNLFLALALSATPRRRFLPEGPAFWFICLLMAAILSAIMLHPGVSAVFQASPPTPDTLILAGAGSLVSLALALSLSAAGGVLEGRPFRR